MARIQTVAVLALAGLSAGGCVTDAPLSPGMNPSISSVQQPLVQRNDYVLDLATAGRGVSPSELDRLDYWFQTLALGYGDRISIDGGQAADPVTRSGVARVTESYGLLLSEGAPITAGAIAPGSVRVIVSRTTASVPGCPQWDPTEIGSRVTTSPNYGCSVNGNLAAMIADPNDLLIGRTGDASIDAATASKAIRAYRAKVSSVAGQVTQESSK